MPTKAMEKHIKNQVTFWEKQKDAIGSLESKQKKPFVTISREYGVVGFDVAVKLVEELNALKKTEPEWAAYDRNLLDKLEQDLGLSKSLAETLTGTARNQLTELFQTSFSKFPTQVAVYRKLAETVRTLAINGNVVIVGRAGNVITKDMSNGFHVRLIAPAKWKIQRLTTAFNIPLKDAEHLIVQRNKERDSYIKEFLKFDNADPLNYHMVLNMGEMTVEEASKIIINSLQTLKKL